MKYFVTLTTLGLVLFITSANAGGEGIIASIVKAPVVADGDVARAATDVVINLDTSMDPNVAGRSLLAGRKITVTLPNDFVNQGLLPIGTPFVPGCAPPFQSCSTAILLQGWPQHPVGFPLPTIAGKWMLAQGATPGTLVITALQDLVPAPPVKPGIKQIHLLLSGFVNPKPGIYRISLVAETGPGGSPEMGSVRLRVRPKPKPSINVASVFNVGLPNPNTIYQQTASGQLTPLPYDFLLWGRNGEPMLGVEISGGRAVRCQVIMSSDSIWPVATWFRCSFGCPR